MPARGAPRARGGRAFDAVVVGGGIIGLACAYRLAQDGARVAVLERERPGSGASGAAAGILAPGHEGHGDPVLQELGARSYALWPAFAAEIERASGIATGFTERGTAVVAEDGQAAEALRTRAGHAGAGGRAEWREGAQLPAYLQGFRIRGALLLERGAHLEPPATVSALATAFAALGGLRTGAEALDLRVRRTRRGRRVSAVACGGELLVPALVVLAAGSFTGSLAARLGVPLPVIPVKGQILSVRTPYALRAWQEAMVPVFSSTVYLVGKADGRTVIGATEEWDAGFDRAVTLGALAWMAGAAASLVPDLAGAPLVTTWAGLRPATPDRRPVLGRLPGYENVLVASGHFRHGILLAPLTAEVVRALAAGRDPDVDLAPLDPGRFAGGGAGAAAAPAPAAAPGAGPA